MTTISAANKVLGIYELLEMVICQTPAQHTHTLKRVSKAWRDVISRSHTIRRSRLLLPQDSGDEWTAGDLEEFDALYQQDRGRAQRFICLGIEDAFDVLYFSSSWPRFNPCLQVLSRVTNGGTRFLRWVHIFLPDSLDKEVGVLDQMVTDPPVCAMSLTAFLWDEEHNSFEVPDNGEQNAACAYNRDGLRIKDLLAVKRALVAAQKTYIKSETEINLTIGAACDVKSLFRFDDMSQADSARVKAAPSQYSADLAYFEEILPRHRRMHHCSETELEEVKANDQKLELGSQELQRLGKGPDA